MKKWVCKKCGLYKRIHMNNIKTGQNVFFIKYNERAQRKDKKIERGTVLSKSDNNLIVLSNNALFTVEIADIYPEDAPVYFIYNMFGVCEC